MLSSKEVPCSLPDSEDDTDVACWLGIEAPGINVSGGVWPLDDAFVFRDSVDAAPASNEDVEDVAMGVTSLGGEPSRHCSPRRIPGLLSESEGWTGGK